MVDKRDTPRPQCVTLNRAPWMPEGDDSLAQRLTEDLLEILQLLRLRVHDPCEPQVAKKLVAEADAPSVITFTDIPGLPPDCVDGALEDLEDFAVAIGPTPDNSLYLVAFNPGLPDALVGDILTEAVKPDCLPAITSLLEAAELEVAVLPPWFRVGNSNQLSFAESLARLSLLSEDGDEQFNADRLRIWFENRQ